MSRAEAAPSPSPAVAAALRAHAHAQLARVGLWLERHRLLFPDRHGGSTGPEDAPRLEAIAAELAALDETVAERALALEDEGLAPPLDQLRTRLELDQADVDVLLALFANETEPDFHRAFRRAAQEGERQIDAAFVAELVAGRGPERHAVEAALRPSGTLAHHGLIALGSDRAWVPRPPLLFLKPKLGARVDSFLQGRLERDRLPTGLSVYRAQRTLDELVLPPAAAPQLRGALAATTNPDGTYEPICLLGPRHSGRKALTAACLPSQTMVVLRCASLPTDLEAFELLVREAVCEAVLEGAALYLDELDALVGDDRLEQRRRLASVTRALRVRVVFGVETSPDALRDLFPALALVTPPPLDAPLQLRLWMASLPREVGLDAACDFTSVVARYSLPSGAICRSVDEIVRSARAESPAAPTVTMPLVVAAVRRQLGNRFGDLAQHIASTFTWDDLVLPDDILQRVLEVATYARHRSTLLVDWGFERKLPYGRSISVLLAGEPGTGKTMVASLLAKELGLELFRVNVSKVVDKYIGETEKNLARIFDEARRGQVALLFDEADSLFSKRTEVRSSTDRYSNLAVNYLLQAVESHEGVILLTSNHEKAIDDAFRRRIRYRIVFPMPQAAERARLWSSMVPPQAKLDPHVDWAALGREFDMAGGAIKNAVVRAALYAVSSGGPITTQLLRRAGVVELEELGRLVAQGQRDKTQERLQR